MRYADPSLCPDCRSDLPHGVPACPTCGLQVRHPLALELFTTLKRADSLVERLRAVDTVSTAAAAPAPARATAASAPAGGPLVPPGPTARPVPAAHPAPGTHPAPAGAAVQSRIAVPPMTPPHAPAPGRRPAAAVPPVPATGVKSSSVPKILLGLGAFFLLVAAIIFLAVSWSQLGVGGRTAVLVGFTLLSGGAALLLHRFELRIAGESLIVVALGMLALDVIGAGSAGWFGDASDAGVTTAAGLVLFVAGAGLGVLRIADQPRLVAPQVIAGIGLLTGYAGASSATDHDLLVGNAVVLLGGGVVLLARHGKLPSLMWSVLAAVGLVWAVGALISLISSVEHPDLETLWGVEGNGWSMLFSAAMLIVPGVVLRNRGLIQWGGSFAALIVTTALAVPCIDTSAETVGLVALLITLGWTTALAVLPALLRPVAIAPAVIGGLILTGLVLVTAAVAVGRWIEVVAGPVLRPGDRFTDPDPVTEQLLTVPSALLVVAIVALLVPGARERSRAAWAAWATFAAGVAGLAGAATVASYDVPVAAALAVLLVTAVVLTAAALLMRGGRQVGIALLAVGAATLTLLLALPWAELTIGAAVAGLAITALLHLRAEAAGLRTAVGVFVAPALGVLVWSTAAAADVDVEWRGVPLLVLVGVLAIARPRVAIEAPAAVTGAIGALAAINAAGDVGASLALHLTVAGCLVSATAVIHESRRVVAWAGGGLLLLATWVRLGDLGVDEPEAYTLPLAAAMVVLGLVQLRRKPEASTAATLTPGLLLATVPSLIWVLDDPTSLRAVLLGIGAVALTLAGAVLRWSAPLVIGGAVGATVVLRELGPYAGDAPVWVWIALGGALLVVVGITWERQLLEVKKAAGMLGRLR